MTKFLNICMIVLFATLFYLIGYNKGWSESTILWSTHMQKQWNNTIENWEEITSQLANMNEVFKK